MSATEVTCLTPPGSGAIAVIALRGPEAWPIARRMLRPASKKPLPEAPTAGSSWFGRIGEGTGDEVILAVPSDALLVEVHCHGGRQVVRWLIEQFCREGCIEVVSFLSPEDPWSLLRHAKTLRTTSILLDQANGAFARAIENICGLLERGSAVESERALRELAQFISVGRHLIEPWRVVIAGAPNAGKSRLLNALAGYQRSIVAPIPGTTRDVVTATLAFDGWPVEVSDTAGLRESNDELEQEGVGRAKAQISGADLCLWVIDVTGSPPSSVEHFAAENGIDPQRVLAVINKTDLPRAWDLAGFRGSVAISALTGAGLDVLIRRMVEMLIPNPPAPGAAVPYSEEAFEMVAAALALIAHGDRDEAVARLLQFSRCNSPDL
jgi:tRNA modification GTPase